MPRAQQKKTFSLVIETATDEIGDEAGLERSLRTIMRQARVLGDPEVVLVDASRDEHVKDALKQYPRVKRVWLPDGDYFSCKNAGFARTTGDIVVFLDCDCALAPDYFKELKKVFERDDIDVCCGQTYHTRHLMGKAMTVIQFYPVPRFQRTTTLNYSNMSIKRDIFGKDPFPKEALRTRLSGMRFTRKLISKHYGIFKNPRMEQMHKFYKEWPMICFRIGYDCIGIRKHDPTFPRARLLKNTTVLYPLLWYVPALMQDTARMLRARRLLKLRVRELPAAFAIMACYRFLNVIGMEITMLYPAFFKKHYTNPGAR